MKNLWLIVLLVIAGVLLMMGCGRYNSFVELDESVNGAWSKVESAYQERADLVPNLVATVKGAADFERGTITDVIEARSKATSINLDASQLNETNMAQFQKAQGQLSGALSRLLVAVERYPELKATQNFSTLQSQLEGIENRIRVERNRFNDVVKDYNTTIRKFPNNFFGSIFGFDVRSAFKADEGASKAPKVEF